MAPHHSQRHEMVIQTAVELVLGVVAEHGHDLLLLAQFVIELDVLVQQLFVQALVRVDQQVREDALAEEVDVLLAGECGLAMLLLAVERVLLQD